MTIDQLSRFKMKLYRQLSEMEQKTFGLREDLLQTAEVQPTILCDPHDHAKEEGDLNNRFGIHNLHMSLRDQLRAALQKIESGTFGKCDTCGDEIGDGRLEVQPSAIMCVECQKISESQPNLQKSSHAWISQARFNCMYRGAA